MSHDRLDQVLDVIGDDEGAPLRQRPHLGATHEREASAHADSEHGLGIDARGLGQPRDVVQHGVVDVHLRREVGHVADRLRGHEGLEREGAVTLCRAREDAHG